MYCLPNRLRGWGGRDGRTHSTRMWVSYLLSTLDDGLSCFKTREYSMRPCRGSQVVHPSDRCVGTQGCSWYAYLADVMDFSYSTLRAKDGGWSPPSENRQLRSYWIQLWSTRFRPGASPNPKRWKPQILIRSDKLEFYDCLMSWKQRRPVFLLSYRARFLFLCLCSFLFPGLFSRISISDLFKTSWKYGFWISKYPDSFSYNIFIK